MIEIVDIKLNKKLYRAKTFRKYEVIKETEYCFYLAIFDGSCSVIDFIMKEDTHIEGWFYSKKEAQKSEIISLRRMAHFLEERVNRDESNL